MIKTLEQIESMKKAGKILATTLEYLRNAIKPGIDGLALDKLAFDFIKNHNAEPAFLGFNNYQYSICLSLNNEVVHGLPKGKVIKSGDLVKIDCGVKLDNMNTDAAISFIIDDQKDSPESKMINDAWKAFYAGVAKIKDGTTIGDVGHAIETIISKNNYGLIMNLTGHGIGKSLHEPPSIPNYGKPNTGLRLKEGMTVCIEPMITLGKGSVITASDGWTIITKDGSKSAHVEHTILVTKNGSEILTISENKSVDKT